QLLVTSRLYSEGYLLEPKTFRAFVYGQVMKAPKKHEMMRLIKKTMGRSISVDAAVRIIAKTIREVANRNVLVGKDLLASCFPLCAASSPLGMMVLAGAPRGHAATFLYLPEGSEDGISYGPHVVCAGAAVRDWTFTSI